MDADTSTDSYVALAFADLAGVFPPAGAWSNNQVQLAELIIEYLGEEPDFSSIYITAQTAAGFASKGISKGIKLGVSTTDSDDDGVDNNLDSFPLDPFEWVDTDSDGIGDNADEDDDNDGFTDAEELASGTNPLNPQSCPVGCFTFDVDESGETKALSDGLLVIRYLFGFVDDALVSGAVADSALRGEADEIIATLSDAEFELDIDGNGESKALSDGLLLIRYLFGFTGDALTVGAIGEGATRDTSEAIEAYISDRVPVSE